MTKASNSTFTRGSTVTGHPQAIRSPRVPSGGFPSRYRSLSFDVADEGGQAIDVTIQVQENGEDVSGYYYITVMSSDTEYGATDTNNSTTITDGGSGQIIKELVTDELLVCLTDSTGELVLTVGTSANTDRYLMCVLDGGDVYSSGAIDFD